MKLTDWYIDYLYYSEVAAEKKLKSTKIFERTEKSKTVTYIKSNIFAVYLLY